MTNKFTFKNKRYLIKKIYAYKVLNSHFDWTNEFVVQLAEGVHGIGTAPIGETLSVYEKNYPQINTKDLLSKINKSKYLQKPVNQIEFDTILKNFGSLIDKNDSLALSIAFSNAFCNSVEMKPCQYLVKLYNENNNANLNTNNKYPTILINVLNGGSYAYSNPVLSDFTEYLLVPQFTDLTILVEHYHAINLLVKERLNKLSRVKVAGNYVYQQKSKDNRTWLEFLIKILDSLGLSKKFNLMVDASGGDLKVGSKYFFSITNKRKLTVEKMVNYWTNLLNNYPIQILEDPFSEKDLNAWSKLTKKFPNRLIAGDNLFATDPARIKTGGNNQYASAALIKPNQNGTISGTVNAIEAIKKAGLVPIISHRSIETESTILSDILLAFNIPFAKLGLFSDFETTIKINYLIRLIGKNYD